MIVIFRLSIFYLKVLSVAGCGRKGKRGENRVEKKEKMTKEKKRF